MKPLTILLVSILACLLQLGGTQAQDETQPRTYQDSWNHQDTFLSPYRTNAYGPNIHSDATGRPFQWQTQDGSVPLETLRVQPNAYGPGIGKDQYGRPVKPKSWP